jgi:hypothetical protein
VLNTQGRVLNTRKPCQDSRGNSGAPNVRVTVAVENTDGIDGHGHTPLPEGGCLRQGADVLHRSRPSQTLVHAIRVAARIKFRVTGAFDRDSAEFNVHGQLSFSALERSFHS